jgi:hypothetical protein
VLSRIIKDERRHFFILFQSGAPAFAAARRRANDLARGAQFLDPRRKSGAGDIDAQRLCGYLFGDEQGPRRLAEHDSIIARLPGLEWFDMASRYC